MIEQKDFLDAIDRISEIVVDEKSYRITIEQNEVLVHLGELGDGTVIMEASPNHMRVYGGSGLDITFTDIHGKPLYQCIMMFPWPDSLHHACQLWCQHVRHFASNYIRGNLG